MIEGVAAYAEDVRARRYPEPRHGYTMAPDERERLRELLRARIPSTPATSLPPS
jgi:3-methyl-2-oxobutanoate hydroxymethyltransferase